jgi:hypothetical protein
VQQQQHTGPKKAGPAAATPSSKRADTHTPNKTSTTSTPKNSPATRKSVTAGNGIARTQATATKPAHNGKASTKK